MTEFLFHSGSHRYLWNIYLSFHCYFHMSGFGYKTFSVSFLQIFWSLISYISTLPFSVSPKHGWVLCRYNIIYFAYPDFLVYVLLCMTFCFPLLEVCSSVSSLSAYLDVKVIFILILPLLSQGYVVNQFFEIDSLILSDSNVLVFKDYLITFHGKDWVTGFLSSFLHFYFSQ